jgi:hypothetical protein
LNFGEEMLQGGSCPFMNLDRDQLEALKRQIEEEYRLDLSAIDRLLRRFQTSSPGSRSLSTAAATVAPSHPSPAAEPRQESATASTPVIELPQERKPDELTGTLRAMFSSVR